VVCKGSGGLAAEPRLAHALEEDFPFPDRCGPERFLESDAGERRYAFIPSGGGVYACLGAQLAVCIAKVFALEVLGQPH